MNGVDIPIEKMYPPVQFPVSAGTPFISPLIKWDHSEDWFLAKFDTMKDGRSGERTCKIALTDHDVNNLNFIISFFFEIEPSHLLVRIRYWSCDRRKSSIPCNWIFVFSLGDSGNDARHFLCGS